VTAAAVVLAAGAGSRFDGEGHKLLAPFRGRPLATWAIDAAAASGLDEVLVVEGAVPLGEVVEDAGARSPVPVRRLANTRWAEGQAGSLAVAVEAAGAAGHVAVVVGLADQPLVPRAAWRAVADSTATPISVATYGGRRRNPVRLARSVWPLLSTEGDEGARELMRRRPDLVGEVACEGEPVDVDTVEDLARWS